MNNQLQFPDSKCIWTFNYSNKLIVDVDTQNHIIYSEFAFYGTLEIFVGFVTPIFLETESEPHLSLDNKVYYYRGKIKWEAITPQFFTDGVLSFKESDEFGKTNKMKYVNFIHSSPDNWSFSRMRNPLMDVNELEIPEL